MFCSFLLNLGALAGETGVGLELDNVNVCQANIQIWEQNRTRLRAQLQDLRKTGAVVCVLPRDSAA